MIRCALAVLHAFVSQLKQPDRQRCNWSRCLASNSISTTFGAKRAKRTQPRKRCVIHIRWPLFADTRTASVLRQYQANPPLLKLSKKSSQALKSDIVFFYIRQLILGMANLLDLCQVNFSCVALPMHSSPQGSEFRLNENQSNNNTRPET